MKKREALYRFSWANKWFVGKLIVLAYLWYLCYSCFDVVKDIEPLKTFVPHEILGVAADATPGAVKKAYRKLSREKHPDKNPDNPEAVNEFIQITKAYTIMTDEKARDNFLKYGNPDGKGSFAVGIALPNFLQKKDYQLQVLVVFFLIVVFAIPGYFLSRIQSNEKDVGGVDVDNRKIFTELINENMTGKQIPGILAHSQELSAMRVRSEGELQRLRRLRSDDAVKEALPKVSAKKDKQGQDSQVQVKPICLLVGYMNGILTDDDKADEGLAKDLETILRAIPSYMDIMLTQTMMLSQLFKMGRSPKKITAKNIMTLIQFSQNLMQGGWISKDPFSQLPGFDEEECKRAKKIMNGKTLFNYCMLPRAEREAAAEGIFGTDYKHKFEQQEKCIGALPLVKLTMTAFVEGEDEIVVGDILTCKLEVKYHNLERGQKSGYVHSKSYPYLKRDNWFLIITDETFTGLAAVEKITVTEDVFVKEFKERIQRPGKIAFTAILTNDSYKGLDQFSKVEVEVAAQAKNRAEFNYSKEDIKAIKEPTLLQSALDIEEEETDEDEEIDEEDELKAKLQAAGLGVDGKPASEGSPTKSKED